MCIALPDDRTLFDLAELFKLFGDSTRIKILSALSVKEMRVCDIANICNVSQSGISHQLRFLRQSRLVKFRKAGKEIFYSLDDNHIGEILSIGIEHLNERSK